MTTNRWPRRPTKLKQRREDDCVTCVAAQTLYACRRTARPDQQAVDVAMGIHHNVGDVNELEARFYLLRQGLRCVVVERFEVARFVREGLSYLHKLHGDNWGSAHEAYFTPREVERQRQIHLHDMLRLRPYVASGAFAEERHPSIQNIADHLRLGRVVDVTLEGNDHWKHAALIVPERSFAKNGAIWLYDPQPKGRIVWPTTLNGIASEIILRLGYVAWW